MKILGRITELEIRKIVKYISFSVVMYIAMLTSMYLLVDLFGTPKVIAYCITYSLAYILDYLVNLKYLFHKNHSWSRLLKYVLQIAFFLGLGAVIFKVHILLEVNYLTATLMTAILLMPLRYFAYKILVFR